MDRQKRPLGMVRALLSALILGLALPVQAEIEEVVVVARKTEESISDTPVAVTVMDAEFFEETGINTINDMVRFVPGLDLTPQNTSRATGPKIRGISTFSFSDGLESSVATVIDGVVMGREAQGFFDLYGIEAVEVLKGPQGTVFGKNASAGVINVRTQAPEFEHGGRADITYGKFDEILIRGTATGPLVADTLAYRLSGSFNEHDGKTNNALAGQDDINDKDTWSVRGKLLFTPNDSFEATLIADYVTEENRCCLPTYLLVGPPTAPIAFASNSPVLQLQDALDQLGIEAGDDNRTLAVDDTEILQESDAYGFSLQMDYDLGWATVTSITAWRDWEIDEFNEADGLSISDVNDRNGTVSDSEQFSQELRLSGQITDNIDFVAGGYYFDQDLNAQGLVSVELAPFFNAAYLSPRTVKDESIAAFGEFTIHATEKLSLVLGARYTHEEKEATFERITVPIAPGLCCLLNPFGGADFSGEQKVSDDDVSGRAILRYHWNDNVMTYATWSQGYKGAGINVAVGANEALIAEPGGLEVLDPEIPTLYELGAKLRVLEDTLVVNLAGYLQEVEDLQAIARDEAGIVRNRSIGEVTSKGFELDVIWAPLDGFVVTAGVSYTDAEVTQDPNPDLDGGPWTDVPEWLYSLTADYEWALGDDGYRAFIRGELTGQTEKNSSLGAVDPSVDIDGYALVNLRLGIMSPGDRYRVTFMVENLFDVDYQHFVFGSSYSFFDGTTRSQYLGDPFTYAVQVAVNF